MKKTLTTMVAVAGVFGSGIIGLQMHNHTGGKFQIPFRGPAQAAPSAISFQDISDYFKEHVTANPHAVIVQSPKEAVAELIRQHLASDARGGSMELMNNIGTSDSGYRSGDQMKLLAKTEIAQKAAEMAKNGGGTIVVAAGNTNTGVGLIVEAAQEKAFVQQMWERHRVRVVTAGVSAAEAVINHGEEIEFRGRKLGGYSKYFMNVNQDVVVAVPGPAGEWTVKGANGVSAVVDFTTEFYLQTRQQKISSRATTILREGGYIGMGEGAQSIFEILRLARQLKMDVREIGKAMPIIFQQGLNSGTSVNEVTADKGPRAVTDGLINLYQASKHEPGFRNLLESLDLRLERFDSNGVSMLRAKLDFKMLEETVKQILKYNGKLLADAKAFTTDLRSGTSELLAGEKLGILEGLSGLRKKAEQLKKEAPDSREYKELVEYLERADADIAKGTIRDLGELKKALKAGPKGTPAYEVMNKQLLRHQEGVRIRAFSNSLIVFLQELVDLNKGYAVGKNTELKSLIDGITEKVTKSQGLEIKGGKAVRAVTTEIADKVKEAARR